MSPGVKYEVQLTVRNILMGITNFGTSLTYQTTAFILNLVFINNDQRFSFFIFIIQN